MFTTDGAVSKHLIPLFANYACPDLVPKSSELGEDTMQDIGGQLLDIHRALWFSVFIHYLWF
jgi:hypothetical protein